MPLVKALLTLARSEIVFIVFLLMQHLYEFFWAGPLPFGVSC